ncbi:MAG: pyridoxamine 5'-phosphate oxidase family protein [Calditrichaeota bacterium]|nr:MAG: pyridoxamine 5'-phosphate oxidase family protein [Calditrichota bacterium]
MDINRNWGTVKNLFKSSFKSSFHYAIASVTEDGEPHVTPIGSLILGKSGQGFYFEKFPQHLPQNIKTNKQICVLAVNSSRWFWFKSLVGGKFTTPPAVRLHGVAGELRDATDIEIALWQKRVNSVRFSKGHALMWREMCMVREIKFNKIEPVQIGKMTRDNWSL